MSCYLNFYGVPCKPRENGDDEDLLPKAELDETKKPICIVSFSRNSEIFQYFDENCSIHFCYNETKYTDIEESDVDRVIGDINNDIRSSEKRLAEYEKYAGSNPDFIQDILSTKEYIEDLTRALHYAEFIGHIVRDASLAYSDGFGKIVANMG